MRRYCFISKCRTSAGNPDAWRRWRHMNEDGLQANHAPFHMESAPEPFGTLYGYVARANPVWRDLSRNNEALVIFQGPQTYISPSWYNTKKETGMVVPTWNYAVVQKTERVRRIKRGAFSSILPLSTRQHFFDVVAISQKRCFKDKPRTSTIPAQSAILLVLSVRSIYR